MMSLSMYRYFTLICLNCFIFLISFVNTAKLPSEIDDNKLHHKDSSNLLMFIGFSTPVVIVLAIVMIIVCGDCYNSEVGSENHPACGNPPVSQTVKWGGGDGYTPQSMNLNEHVSTFSVSNPGASSFRGYAATPPTTAGRGYNPVLDSQAPPPAYTG